MTMSVDQFRLMQSMSQGGGMFGNITEPYSNPFGNSSLFGSNPLLGVAAQIALPSLFGQQGMLFGQFSPSQNMYDQLRAQQYQVERMRALQEAGQGDRQTYVRMARGMASMAGTPFGMEQLRAANTLAGDAAAIVPFLAPMMPDTIDQLHGVRGSQAVMSMMLHRGGYAAVDPVTGMSGLSGQSSGVFAKEMYDRLYGSKADLGAMRGIGAGAAGGMYAELQSRGLMGGSIGLMSQPGQAQALGMTENDMLKLGSPRLDEAKRQFDARQAADRIKNLTGAVSAMKDIFGDMGHPDAPMAQLIGALDNLTQGGLATMSAGKLEQTVRHVSETAKQTGVGMQAMFGLMAQGSELSRQFGIDPSFAIHASQGAVNFGAAFGDVGGGQHAAFGRLDRDKYTLMDQKLRVAASASGQANQYGALLRYDTEVGKFKGNARNLIDAIKAGKATYLHDGVERSTYLQQNEALQIMAGEGVNTQVAAAMIRDRGANQPYVFQHRVGDYVRDFSQTKEVKDFLAMQFQGAAGNVLASMGVDGNRARGLADKAAQAIGNAMTKMDAETRADPTKRNAAIRKLIQGAIGNDIQLTDEQLNQIAVTGWGNAESGVRNGQMAGYTSVHGMLDAQNETTLMRGRERHAQQKVDAEMGKALAGLGRAGPLARMADMLMSPPGSAGEALGKFLGGVPLADIENRLGTLTSADSIDKAADPERMGGMLKGLKAVHAAFEAAKINGASADDKQHLVNETNALISGGPQTQEHIDRILAEEGLSRDDLDEVLAGNRPQVSEAKRDRLRGLLMAKNKGVATTASDTGIAVGAQVGEKDIAEIRAQGGRLGVLLRQGKLSDKEQVDAKRYAKFSLEQGGNAANLVLDDEATLKAAGHGGLERAKKIRETLTGMRALAAEKGGGKSVEELLATGDPNDPTVKQLREMYSQYQGQLGDLHFGFGRGDKLTDKELEAAKEHRDANAGDHLEQNKELLRKAVKASGGHLSEKSEEELAKQMGSGEQGDIARHRIQKAIKLREDFAKRQSADKGFKDSKEGKALMAEMGAFGRIGSVDAGGEGVSEAVTGDNIRSFVQEGQAKPDNDPAGKKGKQEITGRLILEDPHHVMVVASTTGGTGSTPVAMS